MTVMAADYMRKPNFIVTEWNIDQLLRSLHVNFAKKWEACKCEK